MNEQDRLYRLLMEFHQQPSGEGRVAPASPENEYCLRTRRCRLDRDWTEAMESGLPYVERAIEEQRRYLRQEREVVRIDRAKQVSSDSVRYLAQHSHFVTHKSEGGGIMPDKLLVVKREETYAIYENRFLYSLIMSMQAFVDRRFQEIARLRDEVSFVARLHQRTEEDGQETDARFLYSQPVKRSVARTPGEPDEALDTLEGLRKRVGALAASPLVVALKGTQPVVPPIVHTNVMKKSVNFRQALVLYEFLEGYRKPGYTVLTDTRGFQPAATGLTESGLRGAASLQALALSLLPDPGRQAALEERRQEDMKQRERERQLEKKAGEEETLRLVNEAREAEAEIGRAEAARLAGELAKRDALLREAEKRLTVSRASVQRYSATVAARAGDKEKRAAAELARWEKEAQRLKGELETCAHQLAQEKEEHARTKERDKQLIQRQKESFEGELKKKDADWKRRWELEREKAERLKRGESAAFRNAGGRERQ